MPTQGSPGNPVANDDITGRSARICPITGIAWRYTAGGPASQAGSRAGKDR